MHPRHRSLPDIFACVILFLPVWRMEMSRCDWFDIDYVQIVFARASCAAAPRFFPDFEAIDSGSIVRVPLPGCWNGWCARLTTYVSIPLRRRQKKKKRPTLKDGLQGEMSDPLLHAMVDQNAEPTEVEPSFAGQICCVSTHLPNQILVLNCPGTLYTFLRSAIRTGYRPGILREQGQQCIILNGQPFQGPGPGEISGPQLHLAIVRCMLSVGWEIACSSRISLRVPEVHTFFFQKSRQALQTDGSIVLCVLTFAESNLIKLIDAPVALVELVKTTLDGHWKKGEKKAVKYSIANGVPQFKLSGRVFDSMGKNELMAARMLLSQIISKLAAASYHIVTSCQTRRSDAGMGPQELDTWIIRCPNDEVQDSRNGAAPLESFRD